MKPSFTFDEHFRLIEHLSTDLPLCYPPGSLFTINGNRCTVTRSFETPHACFHFIQTPPNTQPFPQVPHFRLPQDSIHWLRPTQLSHAAAHDQFDIIGTPNKLPLPGDLIRATLTRSVIWLQFTDINVIAPKLFHGHARPFFQHQQ